jgi:EpsI family protein
MDRIGMKNRNLVIVFTALVACAAYAATFEPPEIKSTISHLVETSKAIGGWEVLRDIEMDYGKYTALDPNSLIFRDYINGKGEMVNLAVVYHQNDRWGAHDPTVCYKSQGWSVMPIDRKVQIGSGDQAIELSAFRVRKANHSSLVYYFWFSSNKKPVADRTRQMMDMVINGLVHGFVESGFVRFSIAIDSESFERQEKALQGFAQEFARILLASI